MSHKFRFNRDSYSRETISKFDIIGSYFVHQFYNTLYIKSKNDWDRTENNESLTFIYKRYINKEVLIEIELSKEEFKRKFSEEISKPVKWFKKTRVYYSQRGKRRSLLRVYWCSRGRQGCYAGESLCRRIRRIRKMPLLFI